MTDLLPALRPLVERLNLSYCWVKRQGQPPNRIAEPLDDARLSKHLSTGPAYGATPIAPGTSTTRVSVLDLDSHGGETSWEDMAHAAIELIDEMHGRGLRPRAFRSSGGKGIHLYCLWDEPQDAHSVRHLLADVLAARLFAVGTGGVKAGQVEVFPKQASVALDGFGSMFILPLSGQSVPLDPSTLQPLPREAALELVWPSSEPVLHVEPPQRALAPLSAPLDAEDAKLRDALAAIPNGVDDSLEYDAWRSVVFAVHHATCGSDEGLALVQEFSSRSPKYDAEFLERRVWPYIRHDRGGPVVTVRTLFDMARKSGWVEPIEGEFEVIEDAPGVAPKHPRFYVTPAHEFSSGPAPEWMVKGVLPRADLVVLYGESGSGKSFVTLDLAAAVSRGEPWRGLRVRKGRVVYVCAEGAGGFRQRLRAWARGHEADLKTLDLGVVADVPNLLSDDDVALAKTIDASGGADLIVVDTFAQATAGADENSAEDVGRALQRCRRLRRATGATVLLVHHAGKDPTKGARGWSGLRAAADAELEVTRAGNDRVMTVTKQKDGEDGRAFGFRLVPLAVGVDADGDEVSSCTVEHVEAVAPAQRVKTRGAKETVLLQAIEEISGLSDTAVGVEEVIEAALRRLPSGDLPPARVRANLRRALESLMRDGLIDVLDGRVRGLST